MSDEKRLPHHIDDIDLEQHGKQEVLEAGRLEKHMFRWLAYKADEIERENRALKIYIAKLESVIQKSNERSLKEYEQKREAAAKRRARKRVPTEHRSD